MSLIILSFVVLFQAIWTSANPAALRGTPNAGKPVRDAANKPKSKAVPKSKPNTSKPRNATKKNKTLSKATRKKSIRRKRAKAKFLGEKKARKSTSRTKKKREPKKVRRRKKAPKDQEAEEEGGSEKRKNEEGDDDADDSSDDAELAKMQTDEVDVLPANGADAFIEDQRHININNQNNYEFSAKTIEKDFSAGTRHEDFEEEGEKKRKNFRHRLQNPIRIPRTKVLIPLNCLPRPKLVARAREQNEKLRKDCRWLISDDGNIRFRSGRFGANFLLPAGWRKALN